MVSGEVGKEVGFIQVSSLQVSEGTDGNNQTWLIVFDCVKKIFSLTVKKAVKRKLVVDVGKVDLRIKEMGSGVEVFKLLKRLNISEGAA